MGAGCSRHPIEYNFASSHALLGRSAHHVVPLTTNPGRVLAIEARRHWEIAALLVCLWHSLAMRNHFEQTTVELVNPIQALFSQALEAGNLDFAQQIEVQNLTRQTDFVALKGRRSRIRFMLSRLFAVPKSNQVCDAAEFILGQLKTIQLCQDCKLNIAETEPFTPLLLNRNFSTPLRLADSLNFLARSVQCDCPNCGALGKVIRQERIVRVPRLLIVVLKGSCKFIEFEDTLHCPFVSNKTQAAFHLFAVISSRRQADSATCLNSATSLWTQYSDTAPVTVERPPRSGAGVLFYQLHLESPADGVSSLSSKIMGSTNASTRQVQNESAHLRPKSRELMSQVLPPSLVFSEQ